MTACYLVRHAHAGKRGATADDARGLSDRGRDQSLALAETLSDQGIRAIIASPFIRCVQTIEPLAHRLGISVLLDAGLAEGAGPSHALAHIEAAEHPIALCSHGDIIGEVMNTLSRRGVILDNDRVAKGSTWELSVEGGSVVSARYHPPST